MKISTLHDLFIEGLQDAYSAEKQIIAAIPTMMEKATLEVLKNGLETHLEETNNQVKQLEQLCNDLDIDPNGKECLGMKGLISEGEELLSLNDASAALDLGIIGIAQKVEHYEIAGYGTLANYAKQMNHTEALDSLLSILQEEKETDEKLTQLAEALISQAPSGM